MKYYGAITDDYDIVNKKYVDAHSGGGGSQNVWYGTCSTGYSAPAKVVATTSGDFSLTAGNIVFVTFTNTNTATATLNVDGTGAITIRMVTGSSTSSYYWTSGETVAFVYNGTYFLGIGEGIATTSYYGVTKLSSSTSSTSTTLAASASAVKSAYDLAATKSKATVTQVSLTVAGWNATTTCTVSVTGVTASNSVIISPAPASIADYVSAGVYCSAQAAGTLTFECASTPTADLVVNVMIVE